MEVGIMAMAAKPAAKKAAPAQNAKKACGDKKGK